MDLRTGQPLWPAQSPRLIDAAPLARDESCDVLVVGSGISGAMAAYHLVEAGLDVVLVDRRQLTLGSTPASTALIQYDSDLPLIELAQHIGPIEAQRVYRRLRQTIEDLSEIIVRAGIDCDLVRRPSLYLARNHRDVELLKTELRARVEVGIEVDFVDKAELADHYRIAGEGAIRSAASFELDPWKLTQGLLRYCVSRGVRAYAMTEVESPVETTPDRPARTSTGHTIRYRDLVFATGYESPAQFEFVRKLTKLKSTYALATHPMEPERCWADHALLWEHNSPYFYARMTRDNRIVAGGEDIDFVNPTLRDALLESKTHRLLEKLAELTGIKIDAPAFAWTGTFAETADSLPYIGPAPEAPHCLLALGYGGNGFTFSLLAAQLLRERVLGRLDPDDGLFSFTRAGVRSAP